MPCVKMCVLNIRLIELTDNEHCCESEMNVITIDTFILASKKLHAFWFTITKLIS